MDVWALWPFFLALGAVAGLLAGLLGIGGGLVVVPALIIILPRLGVHDQLAHLAVGTSLMSIVFTSVSSVWAHNRLGAVRWPVVSLMAPGIVTGALAGVAVADMLPSIVLQRLFGVFELFVAIQMTMDIAPKPHRSLPGRAGMFGAANVIGLVSAIVGIGGGTLTVPFLVWCNVKMREAVATAAACGFPIAVAGSAGFVISGWGDATLPANSFGYVYWPAVIGIVAASVVVAPLGAALAHRLPTHLLKRVFAIMLYLLAARMMLQV